MKLAEAKDGLMMMEVDGCAQPDAFMQVRGNQRVDLSARAAPACNSNSKKELTSSTPTLDEQ